MNSVILCGRLTKEPENRDTTTTQITTYTLAVDRTKKGPDGKREADFIDIKVFSNGALFARTYLHKGTKLIVRGRIQTGKYTNREGKTVYTTEVVADEQEFAESKAAAEQQTPAAEAPRPADTFLTVPDAVDDTGLPFK